MYDIDDKDYEIVNDLKEDIKPGEILYANFEIQYRKKGKVEIKKIREGIISRPYESNWPVIEGGISFNRWFTPKEREIVTDVVIKSMKIIVRTGFIHKNKGGYSVTGARAERDERLDNGSFV